MEFWLATDNGPLRVTLPPQESVAFIPEAHVDKAKQLLRGENNWRITPLELKDFHRQPVYGLYCRAHRQLMRYENCCARRASPCAKPIFVPGTFSDGAVYYRPCLG